MTATEQSWMKTAGKQIISSIVILSIGAIVGLTSFYYKTTAEIASQRETLQEVKASLKESSPEEVKKVKDDMLDLKEQVEAIQIKADVLEKVMTEFKNEQDKKVDKIIDLLIEIKSKGK
jgi:predicted negative regulator of RcsB-dependent stress response